MTDMDRIAISTANTAARTSTASDGLSSHAMSLAEQRLLVEQSPDLILLHDKHGICLAAHVPANFPVPPAEQILGKSLLAFLPWHCSAEDLSLYSWILEAKEPQVLERVLPSETSNRFYEIRIIPAPDERLMSIAREVTARRETEDGLRAALQQKELRLKELHHRVKNNLQVMISLLSLQASAITDPLAQASARESERRVRSIAIVHNYLDRNRDDGRVDLGNYIRGVVEEIFHAFGASRSRIQCQVDADSLEVGWELATNIGLIVNELVSNVLKHAFPHGRSGDLQIDIKNDAVGSLAIHVTDSGCGLSQPFSIYGTKTLGLQLVSTLVEQLHGAIDVSSRQGTSFVLRFPPGTCASRKSS